MNFNKNISNFINDKNSNYILMHQGNEITAVKRLSFKTFFGRLFSWLTGRSYDLKTISNYLKKASLDTNQSELFLNKLNERIENYNKNI